MESVELWVYKKCQLRNTHSFRVDNAADQTVAQGLPVSAAGKVTNLVHDGGAASGKVRERSWAHTEDVRFEGFTFGGLQQRNDTTLNVQREVRIALFGAQFRREFIVGQGKLDGFGDVTAEVGLLAIGCEGRQRDDLQRVLAVVGGIDFDLSFNFQCRLLGIDILRGQLHLHETVQIVAVDISRLKLVFGRFVCCKERRKREVVMRMRKVYDELATSPRHLRVGQPVLQDAVEERQGKERRKIVITFFLLGVRRIRLRRRFLYCGLGII